MKKILLIGGAGYLGSALLELLASLRKYDVTVIDTFDWGYCAMAISRKPGSIQFIKHDATKIDSLPNCDVVVNLAAMAGEAISKGDPAKSVLVNAMLPMKLASLISQKQRLIQISTTAVYGDLKGAQASCNVINLSRLGLYAKAKATADLALVSHPRACVLRLATLYGVSPIMRPCMIVHDMIQQGVNNGAVILYGRIEATRPYVHVSDAAMTILRILDEPDSYIGEPKICATENMTKSSMATIIARHLQAEVSMVEYWREDCIQDHIVTTMKGQTLAGSIHEIADYYRVAG